MKKRKLTGEPRAQPRPSKGSPGDRPVAADSGGADAARQARAQRAAHHAEVLKAALFPSLMAEAIGHSSLFDGSACKVYLERLLVQAGNPSDPVEVMLLEQLALAHFRTGQLHVVAAQSKGTEAIKLLNAATARLLGEMRRTALALRTYRGREPEAKKSNVPLKLFKAAQ